MEIIEWGGWKRCARLDNGHVELIVTLEVGPRIISCRLRDGDNMFATFDADLGRTGDPKWRSYGGHRLWHAPEHRVRTYSPDNEAVEHQWDGKRLFLKPKPEPETGIQKSMTIALSQDAAAVQTTHSLANVGLWDVTLAPWALSVLAPGGTAFIPQEPFCPWPEALLPARPLVVWPYTNMSDPRYTWHPKFTALRQDANMKSPQKIGVRNSVGWSAYVNNGTAFIKRTRLQPDAQYPDFGSNWEIYTNPRMLELETLGPLTALCAGGAGVEHVENWEVRRVQGQEQLSVFEELASLHAHSTT